MRLVCTTILLLLFTCKPSFSAAPANLAEAEKLFQSGKAAEAREVYRNFWQEGSWRSLPNPSGFFWNWAVLENQGGSQSNALVASFLALRYAPDNNEANDLYQSLRKQSDPAARTIEPSYSGLASLGNFRPLRDFHFYLLGVLAFFVLLLLDFREGRPSLRSGVGLLLAICLGILGYSQSLRDRSALAFFTSAVATHSGPGENFPTSDTLAATTMVRVAKEESDWLQIAFKNNSGPEQIAWVPKKDILYIPPL